MVSFKQKVSDAVFFFKIKGFYGDNVVVVVDLSDLSIKSMFPSFLVVFYREGAYSFLYFLDILDKIAFGEDSHGGDF